MVKQYFWRWGDYQNFFIIVKKLSWKITFFSFHGWELPLVESQLTFKLLEYIIFDDSRNRFSIKAFDALSFWKTFRCCEIQKLLKAKI